MFEGCYDCLIKQAERLLDKYKIKNNKERGFVLDNLVCYIKENDFPNLPAPVAARVYLNAISAIVGEDDLFYEEKHHYNNLLLERYSDFKKKVKKSENPLYEALKLSVAGNIIDFGPLHSFDAMDVLEKAGSKIPAINDASELFENIKSAKTILYLGDNCGEIVLDKLFIETIGRKDIYFATRGGNVINDVTLFDAKFVGMDNVANIISNGYDAPSTILGKCSDDFLKIYNSADLIISKGQGNLEGLYNEKDKNIFFLLMAKCPAIANLLGVNQNDVVIAKNAKINV